MNTIKRALALSMLLVLCVEGKATHISGGQIQYRHISGTTYEIRFIGYRNVNGIQFQNGTIDFGDGTSFGGEDGAVLPWVREDPENGREKWQFALTHTYTGAGNFRVSYSEENRSGAIQNIPGSISTPFYLEAMIAIDPLFGGNSSPSFDTPDFYGAIGQPYFTSFSIEDPDGDSLSYRLTQPLQGSGTAVEDYLYLDDPSLYQGTPGLFQLSSTTGNLIWATNNLANIPDQQAVDFNLAIKVFQWRNGFIIGETTIDYTIEVWNLGDTAFEPLEIAFPESRCFDQDVTQLEDEIVFNNPSGSELKITFNANNVSFLVNDKTPESWNEEMQDNPIIAENFVIEVRSDRTKLGPEDNPLSKLKMNVTSASTDVSYFDITQSHTLSYGINCNLNALSVDSSDEPIIRVVEDGINILSNTAYNSATIVDFSGKKLEEVDISETMKVDYPFKKNTTYLLILTSAKRNKTLKFVIK